MIISSDQKTMNKEQILLNPQHVKYFSISIAQKTKNKKQKTITIQRPTNFILHSSFFIPLPEPEAST